MAGTINVDTDHLQSVIDNINIIQGAIDGHKTTISGLSASLDQYLSGSASIIATVENAFATTMTNLTTADTSLSDLSSRLATVLADALAAIGALTPSS